MDDEWKMLHSFEYIWLEINEKGQIRTGDDVVHDPVYDPELGEWRVIIPREDDDDLELSPVWFVKQQFNKEWKPNG